jgi:hypothetical protein
LVAVAAAASEAVLKEVMLLEAEKNWRQMKLVFLMEAEVVEVEEQPPGCHSWLRQEEDLSEEAVLDSSSHRSFAVVEQIPFVVVVQIVVDWGQLVVVD